MVKPLSGPMSVARATQSDWHAMRWLLEYDQLPTDDLSALDMSRFLVVRDAKGTLGAVGVELHGNAALLRSLVVAEAGRRQGVGRLLTNAAEEVVHVKGAKTIYLLTLSAVSFFESLGCLPLERTQAREAIQRSRQFSSLCLTAAVLMVKNNAP